MALLFLLFVVAIVFLWIGISDSAGRAATKNSWRREEKEKLDFLSLLDLDGNYISGQGIFMGFSNRPWTGSARSQQFTICDYISRLPGVSSDSEIESLLHELTQLNDQNMLFGGFVDRFYPQDLVIFSASVLLKVQSVRVVNTLEERLSSGNTLLKENYYPLIKLDTSRAPKATPSQWIATDLLALIDNEDHQINCGCVRMYIGLDAGIASPDTLKKHISQNYRLDVINKNTSIAEVCAAAFENNEILSRSREMLSTVEARLLEIENRIARAKSSPVSQAVISSLESSIEPLRQKKMDLEILQRDSGQSCRDIINVLTCMPNHGSSEDISLALREGIKELVSQSRSIHERALGVDVLSDYLA